MGVRIQPTPALRRVVRGDYLRDMSYPLPPAHCMQGLLACNGAYEYTVPKEQYIQVIYCSGNILDCKEQSRFR